MKKNWIEKQREEAEKMFKPKIHYDKEHDILGIWWFPHLDCEYSVETKETPTEDGFETEDGFVFDLTKGGEVKGVEIFDFMEKIKKEKKKK